MDPLITIQERFPFLDTAILQARLKWSVRLRWLAISGYFFATFIAYLWIGLELHYRAIWIVLALLGGLNLVYQLSLKFYPDFSFRAEVFFLHIHIIFDLLFLTTILHLSGGIENPAYLFFVFHVVISSILFSRRTAFLYSLLTIILFAVLIFSEAGRVLCHYTLFDAHIPYNMVFVSVVLICFTLTILVTHYICTGFMAIYRQSKRTIDLQNKKLIEADKQKTGFFLFASHELKSPVIAIKTSLDVVLRGYKNTMDPKAMNLLQRANRRAEQMLKIITELLDLTGQKKLNSPIPLRRVNVHNLALQTITELRPLWEEKHISCETELTAKNPFIQATEEGLSKVLANLIGNAIRYGKENGRVLVRTQESGDSLQLAISDDGIGIPADDLDKIFNEFYRAQNATEMVHFGTGLGLSLVKQITKNFNGTIIVQSEQGKGTTFTLRFPQKKDL